MVLLVPLRVGTGSDKPKASLNMARLAVQHPIQLDVKFHVRRVV